MFLLDNEKAVDMKLWGASRKEQKLVVNSHINKCLLKIKKGRKRTPLFPVEC
jgi:hypothetical protein